MSALDTLRDAIYGNPPVDGFKPSREGVLKAFSELIATVNISAGGIPAYNTLAQLNSITPGANDPKVAFVLTGADANVYKFTGALPWVLFPEYYNAISAIVLPLVTRAETAATTAVGAVTQITPMVVATIGLNDATGTQYRVTEPAGFTLTGQGARFSFIIPETNVGPDSNTYISIFRAGVEVQALVISGLTGQKMRKGWRADFTNNVNGSRYALNLQTIDGAASQETEARATIAYQLVAALTGRAVARTLGGSPNELLVPNAALVDSVPYEVIVTQTNTAELRVTNSNGDRRAMAGGSAGVSPANTILRFQYSGGTGNFQFLSSRPIPTVLELLDLLSGVGTDLWLGFNDTVFNHYGNVTKGGDNRPVFVARSNSAVGRGSSVVTDATIPGRAGAAPAGLAPVKYMTDQLTAAHGPGNTWTARQYAKGGTVQSQAASQYGEAIAADPSVPRMILDGFGMNDAQMSAYNSGQLTPEYLGNPIYYEQEIRDRLEGGVQYYIACTSPHDNTDLQTNTFGGNTLQWPYTKAAPVADAELVPPYNSDPALNLSNTPLKDWTGRGILRRGNTRMEHVNELIRYVIRKLHSEPKYRGRIFLLDCEWAWFRYGVEVYALNQLFNGSETVHMNALGHQVTYQRCIRDFVAASRRGFGDQYMFRGEYAG